MADSVILDEVCAEAFRCCKHYRHEFLMPEHLLFGMLRQAEFQQALMTCYVDSREMEGELTAWLEAQERVPEAASYEPSLSHQTEEIFQQVNQQLHYADVKEGGITHLVHAILRLPDSSAAFLLHTYLDGNDEDFMAALISACEDDQLQPAQDSSVAGDGPERDRDMPHAGSEPWRLLVTCINDEVDRHHPLIGREAELERTIQVLCRKDKNNPLHVGEPGVGKTALVYGLAARIVAGQVPDRLKGSRIYAMDMGTMLSGTQYRGDFEKRIKMVMDGLMKETKAIVYIDEIHQVVGAGRGSEGALDASNMLKPYLERGDLRFIGSTTYEEYNRYMATSHGIVRRFQQIDIAEPTIEQAVQILEGLRPAYEQFHGVAYPPEVVAYAVRQSAHHITGRYLPDKAIDLIDEAGAYRETHPEQGIQPQVSSELIDEILAKICKIDAQAMKESDNAQLATLEERIRRQVFGQDEAVAQVVAAVQMAKAGLTDDEKPMATLLFVGPTGVGKTEVARTLARELGISLVRFDMSEYAEKHAVAKLIGSPAGYVGYEDGGLLTDAIRKSPNCVLLLDEIEKAHQDIYNILLQVMDYARLTDNRGQQADFRNVMLIMTSNAGAQHASQASVGFTGSVSRGEAMLQQVKKTFKPEFINRLSGTVVFHDMSRSMAAQILDKKLDALRTKLLGNRVELDLSAQARDWLLDEGFTHEYGARELDRVIAHHLKPLLMRVILDFPAGEERHEGLRIESLKKSDDGTKTVRVVCTLSSDKAE